MDDDVDRDQKADDDDDDSSSLSWQEHLRAKGWQNAVCFSSAGWKRILAREPHACWTRANDCSRFCVLHTFDAPSTAAAGGPFVWQINERRVARGKSTAATTTTKEAPRRGRMLKVTMTSASRKECDGRTWTARRGGKGDAGTKVW